MKPNTLLVALSSAVEKEIRNQRVDIEAVMSPCPLCEHFENPMIVTNVGDASERESWLCS
ncbi:MAG: hypothetical protein ACK5MG_01660 [Bacteroidales bacterium]